MLELQEEEAEARPNRDAWAKQLARKSRRLSGQVGSELSGESQDDEQQMEEEEGLFWSVLTAIEQTKGSISSSETEAEFSASGREEGVLRQGRSGGAADNEVTTPAGAVEKPMPVRQLSSGLMREMARAEIVETERTYVANLELVEVQFKTPMVQWVKRPVVQGQERVSPEEIQEIFADMSTLLSVNRKLLGDLTEAYKSGNKLSEVFLAFGPYLKLYTAFVTTYEDRQMILGRLERRPDVAAFIAACELQPAVQGCSLRRLLSLPVQRVPQYKLLLREVLKHTKVTHPSHPKLEQALAEIDKVAWHVNNSIDQASRLRREAELRHEWRFDGLDNAARALVKEGFLTKLHDAGGTGRVRVVIFSDMLIYGTELRSASLGVFKSSDKSQLYSLRRTIMLHEGCDVMDSATYLRVGGTAGAARQDHAEEADSKLDDMSFKLLSPDRNITFRAKSSTEKDNWVVAIRTALDGVPQRHGMDSFTHTHASGSVSAPLSASPQLPPASPQFSTMKSLSSQRPSVRASLSSAGRPASGKHVLRKALQL